MDALAERGAKVKVMMVPEGDGGAMEDGEGGDEDSDEGSGPLTIEAEGIRDRIWRLPVEPGNHRSLIATAGGVYFLSDPTRGIADVEWPAPPLGEEIATLRHFGVVEGETKEIAEGIASFAASKDAKSVAWMKDGKFHVHALGSEKDEVVDPSTVQIAVDPKAEWSQMLEETWRLQRDFYWAPNMAGVDWNAMRERYRALLPGWWQVAVA